AGEHSLVAVLEDGVEIGGVGSQSRSDLREADSRIGVVELGVPDEFLPQGTREESLAHVGLDVDTIVARIVRALPAAVAHRAEEGRRRAVCSGPVAVQARGSRARASVSTGALSSICQGRAPASARKSPTST